MKKQPHSLFDFIWSPWQGCSEISVGCQNCFIFSSKNISIRKHDIHATRLCSSHRNAYRRSIYYRNMVAKEKAMSHKMLHKEALPRQRVGLQMLDFFEDWQGGIQWHDKKTAYCREDGTLILPTHHDEPFRPATMSDLQRLAFRDMDECDELDFFVSTRRPERILETWTEYLGVWGGLPVKRMYRENFWLGISASTQQEVNQWLHYLLECRHLVPILFLQLQPLLEPIVIPRANELDWIITGAEIGNNRRPCEVPWIASVVQQAKDAKVPCYVTQGSQFHSWKQMQIPDDLWCVKEIPVVPEPKE